MQLSNGERLFSWPLNYHVITAGWTYSDGSAHGALDFRATVGTPVYASEAGTVNWVQAWDGKTKTGNQSYGNLVRIRHADYNGAKLETYYAHLSSVSVKNGQTVTEGQLIGYSGNTGNSTGPHLHYEVRLAGSRVNPLNWLDADFTTAYSYVNLGTYKSVECPAEQEDKPVENKLQKLCIVNPTNDIIASAKEKGLPVEIRTCALIGPASDGDAMDLWQQSEFSGSPYFSSYTED